MSAALKTSSEMQLQALDAELDAAFPLPSVRRVARLALLTVVVGFGGLLLWGFVTPVERAAIASGQLIPEGRRKTISLLEPGVLKQMMVKDGDRVTRGQVLFQLDTAQALASADQARATYWGGLARIARLKAEQNDQRTLEIPAEIEAAAVGNRTLRELIETERRLFPARWEAFDGASAVQLRVIAQVSEQLAGIPRQRRATERQLEAIQERIRGFADLARTGVGSRFRVLELIEPEQSYTSTLAQMASQQAQLTQQIAQAEAQLAVLRLNRQQDIANDLNIAATTVAQAQQLMLSAENVLARRDVTAPEDGAVTNIQLYTPGSSILPGQTVLDLVPLNDRLIVEAHVALNDIEQVAVGQRAAVRLMAYRYRQVPLVPARVLTVSADQQSDPGAGTGPYFMVRLELDQAELAKMDHIVLAAGMPTESYIVGESRTIASYVVAPLVDAMHRSLRD